MFHVNEACKKRGTLTVSDGRMTIHVSLAGKKILNLYPGKASQAASDKENWLKPSLDTVKYDDGSSEEVFGFDIPVPALNEDFDCALKGVKDIWYDHRVSVSEVQ